MADDDRLDPENDEQVPNIVVPTHAPLPPPPAVTYTRPSIGPGGAIRPGGSAAPGPSQEEPGIAERSGAGMAASFSFVSYLIGGILLGTLIDKRWNHTPTPWGVMVMTLAATGVGFYNTVRILSRKSK